MYKQILVLFILSSVILTSCDLNAGTTSITLQETAAAITEVTPDEIHMNNCGGKGEAKQSSERKKSVDVDVSGTIGLDPLVVKGEVATKYSQINEVSKSIELIAPPGTNMVFSLEWTETSWLGIATSLGKDKQATYRVSVPISVSLVSSNDLGCNNASIGNASIDNVPTPELGVKYTKPTTMQFGDFPIIKVGYKNSYLPNTITYHVQIAGDASYFWTYLWCAKYSGTLSDSLLKVNHSFYINKNKIDASAFLIAKEAGNAGWECQRWTTILSEWNATIPITLSVVFTNSEPVSDGLYNYESGEHRHDILITFK